MSEDNWPSDPITDLYNRWIQTVSEARLKAWEHHSHPYLFAFAAGYEAGRVAEREDAAYKASICEMCGWQHPGGTCDDS